jgi:hypothetical protein
MADSLLGLISGYYDRQRQAEDASKFGDMLAKERVAGTGFNPTMPQGDSIVPYASQTDAQQAQLEARGGFPQGNGLLGASPSNDFYLRTAAQIPSLMPGAFQRGQAGAIETEQQREARVWSQENMTAAEKASDIRAGITQTWREEEAAAQRGIELTKMEMQRLHQLALEKNAGFNSSLAQQEFDIKYPMNPVTGKREPRLEPQKLPPNLEIGVDGRTPVPTPGTPEYGKAYDIVSASNALLKDLTAYRQLITGTPAEEGKPAVSGGVSFTGEKSRTADAMRNQLVTRVAKSIAGEGMSTTSADVERAEEMVPSVTTLLGNDKKAIQAVDELIRSESAKSASARSRFSNYRGLPPLFQPKEAPAGYR